MDVSSVSNSPYSPQAMRATAAKRAASPEVQAQREPNPDEIAARKALEPRRSPVVNAQGQTTGQVLNTTA